VLEWLKIMYLTLGTSPVEERTRAWQEAEASRGDYSESDGRSWIARDPDSGSWSVSASSTDIDEGELEDSTFNRQSNEAKSECSDWLPSEAVGSA
jgi:hypothetical protein